MYELNEQQRAAAEFLEGIAIVVAVPGSGKTMIMTHRITNLVMEGTAPESILGITFTRNAANTLRERLKPILGKQTSRLSLSTIHGLCYRILRSEGRQFTLLEDFKKIVLLRQIFKNLRIKTLPTGLVISEIGFAKNRLISPDQYMDRYDHDPTLKEIGYVYHEYEREKDRKYLMDFEDLLTDTCQLMTEDREVRNKYRKIFRHILIDEYQDTNPAQLEIVKILVNGHDNSSLYVVGDDSQSIYSFTGASVDNILHFKKIFPAAHEFQLTLNYRSTPQILEACGNLISHNWLRIDKELITNNHDGEQVIVMEASSEEEEGRLIANEIQAIIARNLFALSDIVVLYRTNSQSRAIEEMFLNQNIPYRLENGLNFYKRREVSLLLDYLRVISDPLSKSGDEALVNILNVPNRYLSNRFKQELKSYATQRGLPIFIALNEMPFQVSYEQRNVREFIRLLEFLRKEADKMTPEKIIVLIRSTLDYDKYITDGDIPAPDDPKIANIDQFQMAASNYEQIEPFLKHVRQFQQEIITTVNEDRVRLMTIHKSKGMEFPVVFMAGLVNGILPLANGDPEEERRIAFVGMSRASKLLHLSYSTKYNERTTEPSIFLREMRYRKNPLTC